MLYLFHSITYDLISLEAIYLHWPKKPNIYVKKKYSYLVRCYQHCLLHTHTVDNISKWIAHFVEEMTKSWLKRFYDHRMIVESSIEIYSYLLSLISHCMQLLGSFYRTVISLEFLRLDNGTCLGSFILREYLNSHSKSHQYKIWTHQKYL